jgi:hypothetical protein
MTCGPQNGLVPSGFRIKLLLTFSPFLHTIQISYLEFITAVQFTSNILVHAPGKSRRFKINKLVRDRRVP